MADEISLTIDGQPVEAAEGTTVLEAVRSLGIPVPTICYHGACTPNAVCRTCVVEVEGARLLAASCITKVADGMVVYTQSNRVKRSRRTILEMLDSAVDLSDAPEILQMLEENDAQKERFPGKTKRKVPLYDDNPMYIRDYSKCVLCWRCVQVCAEDAQYTYALNFSGRGYLTQIATFFDQPLLESTCVFCGQCVGVCPTGALKAKREWLLESGISPAEIMFSERGGK